jgi:hypothetical protein
MRRETIAAMDDDLSVVKFPRPIRHRRSSVPPEEQDIILDCGSYPRRKWMRTAARARVAERERLARLWGREMSRPELRVLEGSEDDGLR